MRTPVIAANWKMHGTQGQVKDWFHTFEQQNLPTTSEIVVCPPFPYLLLAAHASKPSNVKIGGQDLSNELKGAYTGQVSAEMLKDIGCSYVIIGHSERRALNGETNELIAQKVLRALEIGLTPLLCVGETLKEREEEKTEQIIAEQVTHVLGKLTNEQLKNIVIAYEPVWAIGTGLAATAQQAQTVHALIRGLVAKRDQKSGDALRILYGGSVKPENALELLAMPDIDGALVGGASLDPIAFAQIVQAAK